MAARVLIAGAGDLGTHVAQRLRASGHAVWSIARRPRAHQPQLLALDLTRPIGQPLPEVDWLVHCLSPAARDEAAYRAVYPGALGQLLAALPGIVRVAFVSSTAVYGDHGGAEVDEDAVCTPSGFNGRVLLDAERLLGASGRHALILRLGGLYGPGREQLLRRLRLGTALAVAESPLYTNRIHVDDAAAAIAHLLECDAAGVFNLVDDAPTALSEVLDWFADELGEPRLPRSAAVEPADNKRVLNARLRASGFGLRHPTFRHGYRALLAASTAGRRE